MYIFVVTVVVLIVIYLWGQTRKPANFPPGRAWWPVLGNLPELKKISKIVGGLHLGLLELSKKYKTNVLGLKLGKELVITVFNYDRVLEVLTSKEYEGRPDNFFFRLRCMGKKRGITSIDGELWTLHRSFVVRHLRNLGFGKKPMEALIKEEINDILPLLKNGGSSEDQIGKFLAPSVLNILWALAAGKRFHRNDSQLNRLLDLLALRSKAFDLSGGTLSQYPWLRFVAPEWSGYNIIKRMNVELKSLLSNVINEHLKSWSNERNDDLIYSFITEMKRQNGANTSFTEETLIMVCLDLFIAGAQTTSNTLDFAFMMMILYPEVQKKIHQTISERLKKDESFEYGDRHRIPYVEAVLMEVDRFCNIAPISGPRRVMKDTHLDGYSIPKNTTVLIHLYSVHYDKEYWGDPEVFRPERFLTDDGQLLTHERLITFALGRRRCLGEALARNCIFMFFVEIMRQYKISLMPDTKMPTGKPLPGITLSPEVYKVKFVPL